VSFNTFGKDFPDGGMNETGIHVWKMGLSNSEVIYPKNDQLPRLNQMHWMQYILDNAATLNEAIACAHQFEIDGWGWPFFMGDKEGLFLFAKAALDQNKMALTLNGLETEYGTFELVCRE